MNDINFYVRTTGERKFDYDIPYELIIDTERKPVEKYIETLENKSDENFVLLEDDLVLCRNFEEEIKNVISEYPNDIINFYTRPERYFTTHYDGIFSFNQCTYFPSGIGKKIAETMKSVRGIRHRNMYGMVLNDTLKQMGIRHLDYRPCLVQHIDGFSLLSNVRYSRQTIYFKDYLDDIGITYDDAFKTENEEKLKGILKEDILRWEEAKKNGLAPQKYLKK